jgi:hypothetical protein
MSNRQALPLVDVDSVANGPTGELALEDRQELDDAVLELLGIKSKKERLALRTELYEEITALYRKIREAERLMQHHRSATSRSGRPTAHSIAEEIWNELETPIVYKTPLDFISPTVQCEHIDLPHGRAKIIRQHLFQADGVQIGGSLFELHHPYRCEFVKELSELGLTGEVRVPLVYCPINNWIYFFFSYENVVAYSPAEFFLTFVCSEQVSP